MAFGFPARSSGTQTYNVDPILLRHLAREAMSRNGWNYVDIDRDTILVRFPVGFQTYGERLKVTIDDASTVSAESRCRVPLQLFDWGKNRNNVNEFFRSLTAAVRNSIDPQQLLNPVDKSGRSPLERALDRPD